MFARNSKSKKALIIAYNDLNNSGVPQVIYQTIKALYEEYDFDIVVFGNDLFYFNRLKQEGITNVNIINFYKKRSKYKFKRIIDELYLKPHRYYKNSKYLFKRKSYDVIHSFKEYDSWPFLKAAFKSYIKKRIVHTNVIHKEKVTYFIKKKKKKTINYGNIYVGVTKNACENSWESLNYRVIHSSYDEDRYKPHKCLLKKDELVLLHVGTYSRNKNQIFSINVLKELLNYHNNSSLLLAGVDKQDGYFKEIKECIKQLNLQDKISIVDGSKGVDKFKFMSSFYILPSLSEGASLVAIESQASGIKVFASIGVPKEMNLGGIIYLDLKDGPKRWAQEIFEEFKKEGNKRHTYDTQSFSSEFFIKNIKSLYRE